MRTFIGTKLINAKPMTRQEYNDFRCWTLPENENGDDKGWLVEYLDGGQPNTKEYAGYVSWSPDEVFQNAYRAVDGLSFGLAIEALKLGKKVARAGWNGKGLSLLLQIPDENSKMTLPYIYMQYPTTKASDTAPENHLNARVPWLASQTDMLADDWIICE